ncbi:MAG TPA: SDR family oxidoreductase [Rudaea sp.]|nr:SDR family oxidoreductase [Rudaea sp.]
MEKLYANRCALVTGASAGIGAEFARQLAERGASLVITARRLDRLETLASELRDKHGVRIECIAADLSDTNAIGNLCAEIERRGVNVDILVNNAGYGVGGSFLTPSWRTHLDSMQVLMTAPCELIYQLLPAMQARGYGRIANIASLAGHMPGSAGHTLYAASKAFVIKFSQSLALENADKGVKVCAVCPGFTYSEFHDVVGTRATVSKMPSYMWSPASDVVREGIDAMERGEIVYVTGRLNRFIKSALKLMPDKFALRAIQKRSNRFRRAD